MSTSFADLETLNPEEIRVAPPSEYVHQSGPAMPPPGTYDVKILDFEQPQDREGRVRKNCLQLTVEILTEGDWKGRIIRNLRIYSTPFMRNGALASGWGDFLAGIDDAADWSARGVEGAAELLSRAQDQGLPIRIRFTWEAFDLDGYRADGGDQLVPKSPEQKVLRKKHTYRKLADFRQLPDGSYLPEVISPVSGEVLQASMVIDRVIPSSKVRH